MKDLLLPLLHLAVTAAKLCRPGGVRAVIAENLLLKQQLIVLRRSRQRAPNLRVGDRLLCGFGALVLSPGRIRKVAIGLRPSTLLTFHQALVRGKYRRLFSSSARPKKPGPKGPSESLIRAIVELKSRNPRFGCPRIARIISQTFGVDIDKNVVHRVLAKRYRPAPGGTGPLWLSFVGHTTDSLWSVDLWRCASIVLQSYWVLVVMDQFTRRLVGFGVHRGPVDAPSLCRMCNAAIHGRGAPRHLSTDHDPLFEAHRWTANLRLLEIDEIKTVPHVPLSHPFVERLIGTMRRECLDHVCAARAAVCSWNAGDLERKLADFQAYYNAAAASPVALRTLSPENPRAQEHVQRRHSWAGRAAHVVGFWRSTKWCPMCPCHTPLWNGWTMRRECLDMCCAGMPVIWSGSSPTSRPTTTRHGAMRRWKATRR